MRSRFLSTDYFSSRSPYETLAHFEPLSLPSSLPPSSHPPFAPDGRFFDCSPDFDLSTDVDKFPIEKALGEFLSDVVPRFLEFTDEDRCALEESRSGGDQMEFSEKFEDAIYEDGEEEMNSTSESAASKRVELWNALHFEIGELDIPMKCASSQRRKKAGIRFEVPDTDVPLDMINVEEGIAITYPHALAKSICAVANIPEMFSYDQDSVALKDGCFSQSGKIKHPMKLPCFELNEGGLELHAKLYVEEPFDVVLSKIDLYQGAFGDEPVVNAKEILGPNHVDIFEQFLRGPPCERTEQKQMTLDPALDVDLVDLSNNLLLEKDSAIYPIMQDGDSAHVQCSVQYQEVQILDSPSHIQIFVGLPTAEVLELSEQMFKEDMETIQTLYESVLSSELALMDDTFKSLPEPVPRDEKMINSLTVTVGEILYAIKPHPFSASDGIYLDWHLLLEGPCNREMCLSYMIMVHEIVSHEETSRPQTPCNIPIPIDIELLDDSTENSDRWQCGKVLSELHDALPQQSIPCALVADSKCVKGGFHGAKSEEQFSELNGGSVSSLFGFTSQYNDLNYFLDARRGAKTCQDKIMTIAAGRASPSAVHLEEPSGTNALHLVNHKWVIELHQVKLSDQILGLLDHMQKIYLDILENCTDLTNKLSLLGNGFELIRLHKQKILEFICERLATTSASGQEDESTIASMVLYSIKQLAYYLCFFGVDVAHLYLTNLVKNHSCLTVALRSVKDVIENACWKAGIGLMESHPSLTLIQEILRSHTSQDGDKILIVAERLFWLPLNRKLASLRIRCQEVRDARMLANQPNKLHSSEFITFVLEALQQSQCLLISHEHISASFPVNKFSIILEYGGPCTSSSISSLCAPVNDLPKLHFLKVETDYDSSLKALCEGVDAPQNLKPMMDGVSQFMANSQRSMNIRHIVGLLNWVPIEENNGRTSSDSADPRDSCDANDPMMSGSDSVKSKHTDPSTPFPPDIVVVINTQSFKKMLFSRRSSYQKILAMEKGGAQVVEREIDLPLDLICSASVCLVWYEVRTLGDIRRKAEEIPSTLMFMENIATNVLVSLSFAFSGCIMIFEGDSSFLAALMESSDALYAAAASLGMNIQLFCSYVPETTDEIILNCITNAARLNRSLYPAMPETETIAESFLTRFPSINPLSAHAILSSGGDLMEFFKSSQEHRIQAIEKFHVSDESIYLFSVLCRYGELGESKSVMTECSSIDSDSSVGKFQSEPKKQKAALSSDIQNREVENSLHSKQLNRSNEEIGQQAKAAYQPYWSRNFSMDAEVLCQNRRIRCQVMDNERSAVGGCEYVSEDLRDEVIDRNSTFSSKRYSRVPASISFLRKSKTKIQFPDRSSLPNRVATGTSNHGASPTSSKVNCAIDDWAFLKLQDQDWEEKVCDRLTLDRKEDTPFVQDQGYQKDNFHKCSGNMPELLVKANVLPLYSGNVHAQTTESCSSQQAQNSTMDILQRVKEKRKMHQQNLQCNTCLSCPASLKNIGKSFISRSPSIIDSYRCQGASQNKMIKQNWNKRNRTLVDSDDKDKMNSLLITPTWTPGRQMKKRIKRNWSKETKAQLKSNYEEKRDSLLITSTWTPFDKRARQVYPYADADFKFGRLVKLGTVQLKKHIHHI